MLGGLFRFASRRLIDVFAKDTMVASTDSGFLQLSQEPYLDLRAL